MEKSEIIKKVMAKIAKFNEKQTLDLLYDFIDRTDINKPNLKLKRNISKEEHDTLRSLYDKGSVEGLYTYSLGKFGFNFKDLRVDVTPNTVEIKKI